MTAVFALGSNGSGQLGIGHKEDVSVPKQVLFAEAADPSSPVQTVAGGGNHTLLLTVPGVLFWSGDATTGACGKVTGPDSSGRPLFRPVDLGAARGRAVTHVAATWEASVIVTKDEHGAATNVYSAGLGSKGELGLGSLMVRAPSWERILDFPSPGLQIVDLAACMGHAVVVLSNGEAWGWGNGRKGQLGAPHEAVIDKPRKIAAVDFSVKRAVCGREFTCLLGDEETGQLLVLGSDRWDVRKSAPASVPRWQDIGASWGNVHVLCKDDTLISWGRDDHGQLGLAEKSKVKKIAIGSEHALAFTEDGEVVAWGWGEHGNCGPSKRSGTVKGGTRSVVASSRYIPRESEISSIGAGCATSWISISAAS